MADDDDDHSESRPAPRAWWSFKLAVGAVLMCVAAVGAQFLTADVAHLGPWAMRAVGFGVPMIAVLGLILLTAPPPPPRGHGRSVLGIVVAIVAILLLLTLYLSSPWVGTMDHIGQVAIFGCALFAGVGAYVHLARVLRAAHHPVAAAAFAILAMLLITHAALFVIRYGFHYGILANAWSFTVPGVGERVAPFAFVQDLLARPQVEMERNREEPLRGAYTLVTIVTPIWCVMLMVWLMAQGGFSPHSPPPDA